MVAQHCMMPGEVLKASHYCFVPSFFISFYNCSNLRNIPIHFYHLQNPKTVVIVLIDLFDILIGNASL